MRSGQIICLCIGKMILFAKDWYFNIVTSSPCYAQSNGQAKRTIQSGKSAKKKAMDIRCDAHVP